MIAARSSIPHCAPKAQVVSNSGPSPSTLSVLLMRVQPIGQAQHEAFLHQVFFGEGLAGDGFRAFELGLLVVAGGQRADRVDDVHHHHRAKFGQGLAGQRAGAQQLAGFVEHELEPFLVDDFGAVFAFDHNRFQVLRAHHRAGAAARQLRCPSFMIAAMRLRFSPAGPMHSTLRLLLFWPKAAGRFPDALAPQGGCIVETGALAA